MKHQNFHLNVQILKEGKAFIAYSPELDISSCGTTPAHARQQFQTAVRLFLEEAEKMGTLPQILKEAGFTKTKPSLWESARWLSLETIAVPLHA